MDAVEIVEVGPRDGLQGIGPFVPTAAKIDMIERLNAAGIGRIEIGSFVSASALPQMRDTPELLEHCREHLHGLVPQVLVPSERRAKDALAAGARCLAWVISVSEPHNRSNVRRSPDESAVEYERLAAELPAGTFMRLNLATSFDCPFVGRVDEEAVLLLLDRLVPALPDAEVCLCDTTGRADPAHVASLFGRAKARLPGAAFAFHAHDTYGLGTANVYAAYEAGVRVMDAAVAGLGGCPFAPGATGNVATEDVAWMFARRGVATGIDMDRLVAMARDAAALPGATAGGRVRAALAAADRLCATAPTV
ncbi:hydroxymethylglutaryl-CoA lyase [Lichenibacterium dinghuense]|uniref:hydroxymethylglutaryl-CoA lyase n=1 Tax=Lichenibacterium dinghuense TaxID=2895977 RepID=UPI001F3891F2|nr:hydroxymethylglutaryl-CoA lyase [Lichenibacterium sp. 6Y81]